MNYCAGVNEQPLGDRQFGDMLSGITHLREDEAKELYALITDFLQAHESVSEHTSAWEYALIAYPVEGATHA